MGLSNDPLCLLRRTDIYAIVRAGGKQYRVERNQLLDVDLLKADVGSIVELSDVLLVGGSGTVKVGTPLVDGARVIAEVLEHGRDKKIVVFKYKNKTRYRRRRGHRQDYTRLAIRGILAAGEEAPTDEDEKPKRPARKRAAPKVKVEKTVSPESLSVDVSAAEAPASADVSPPKRRTVRRAGKTAKADAGAKAETAPGTKPGRAVSANESYRGR